MEGGIKFAWGGTGYSKGVASSGDLGTVKEWATRTSAAGDAPPETASTDPLSSFDGGGLVRHQGSGASSLASQQSVFLSKEPFSLFSAASWKPPNSAHTGFPAE